MSKESDNLFIALTFIEEIVSEMPRMKKRSELTARADEILKLVEIVRRKVSSLEVDREKEYRVPDFFTCGREGKI
jgi:hypothetical protein